VRPALGENNRLSQSVQRAGQTQPTQWTLHFVHKCRNVTHLCFDLLLSDSHLAETHRSCHTGVGYRSSFPHSTRNSLNYSQFLINNFLSFLSPKFELVPFPLLHHVVFFHFRSSLASLWLQKGMASLNLRLAPEEEVMVICF
jgi:hypothetical protein